MQHQVFGQYNPPYTNGPWPGRSLPTAEKPVTGMGGFIHDSLFSNINKKTIGYCVVLPKNYYNADYKSHTWPVLYYLHGYTGYETADVWLSEYYFKAAANGSFPEVIMVFPNGMNEWYNDNKNGLNMESHIINELLPHIDARFRTKTLCRAVAGFSMGGYGAIKFHIKYPELFNYAVSIDGALYTPDSEYAYYMQAFGNKENMEANSLFHIFDCALTKDETLPKKLKILILQGADLRNLEVKTSFTEYLKSKNVSHIYISDKLEHNAALFFDKYLSQMLHFQKENTYK